MARVEQKVLAGLSVHVHVSGAWLGWLNSRAWSGILVLAGLSPLAVWQSRVGKPGGWHPPAQKQKQPGPIKVKSTLAESHLCRVLLAKASPKHSPDSREGGKRPYFLVEVAKIIFHS